MGIKTAAKKVGSGIKSVAGKVHKSAMKNGGYSGSVSAGGIKGKVGYKLDDDSDNDDLADDLALFNAIKEKIAAKKAKKVKDDDLSMKAYWQFQCAAHPGVFDDDLVDELWKVGGKIGKFSGSVSRDDDSLTCDSEGNCMLKDELKFEKVKAVAGKAAQRFPGAALPA